MSDPADLSSPLFALGLVSLVCGGCMNAPDVDLPADETESDGMEASTTGTMVTGDPTGDTVIPDGGTPDVGDDTGGPGSDAAIYFFVAYNSSTSHGELYGVLPDAELLKLSGDGWVQGFSVSPAGDYVLYLADDTDPEDYDFHIVSTDGSINDRLAGPENAFNAAWSRDGSIVAFVSGGEVQVWDADSGDTTMIGSADTFSDPWPSPEGSAVAYQDGGALVVAPADGSADPTEIAPDAGHVSWTPDGARLVYGVGSPFALHAVDADGSNDAELAPSVASVGVSGSTRPSYALAPDGSRAAFRSGGSLWSILLDGTGLAEVNGPLVAGGEVFVAHASWSPDSEWIAYIADQDTDGVIELYVSRPDGTGNTRLSTGENIREYMQPGAGFRIPLRWTEDSGHVLYVADAGDDGVDDLMMADPAGKTPVPISSPDYPVTVTPESPMDLVSGGGQCITYGSGDDGFGEPTEWLAIAFIQTFLEVCVALVNQPDTTAGTGENPVKGPLQTEDGERLRGFCWVGDNLIAWNRESDTFQIIDENGVAMPINLMADLSVDEYWECVYSRGTESGLH